MVLKYLIFILYLFFLPGISHAQDKTPQAALSNDTCLKCHAIDQKTFNNSAHGSLNCTDCHTDIKANPHQDHVARVNCATCHDKEANSWLNSDHAHDMVKVTGVTSSCMACHGPAHGIVGADDPTSPVNRKNIPTTCSGCHQQQQSKLAFFLTNEGKTYLGSVHGLSFKEGTNTKAAVCSDCHGAHDINKPSNRSSKLYWANIPQTCGQCHQKEFKEYARGIHGQALAAGSRDAPVCTDCHGEHDIDAVKRVFSRVSSGNIPQTCGQCHAAERINAKYSLTTNVFGSYMQSYHGLALKQGTVTAANCASCHGAHEILPSSDPRSMINAKNLEKTCGQCHPGMSAQVAKGSIHGSFKAGNNPANDMVRNFYIFLIFFVSGLLLLHNVLDFSKKAMMYYRHSLSKGKEVHGFQ